MKEEYDTSSVYYLSLGIIELEAEEIEEKAAKKKKAREDKAKKTRSNWWKRTTH